MRPDEVEGVRSSLASRAIEAAALTGCYNMIHPDPPIRAEGREGLSSLIRLAPHLGIRLVTLCTGSRSRESMWTAHPDNDSREAWDDLVAELEHLLPIAESAGVVLGVEPEIANTVNSPRTARRLLDEVKSPSLKIVMDGANIFAVGDLVRMHAVMDAAFDLLGGDIVLAHAKDLDRDGEAGHLPAGTGLLDYDHYLSLLARSGFDGAIILHALRSEEEAAARLSFVQSKLPRALKPGAEGGPSDWGIWRG